MESHGKLNHLKKLWVDFFVYHDRPKFHGMYFTELWIINHGKDGKSHGKRHEKSWNFSELKKYEPCNNISDRNGPLDIERGGELGNFVLEFSQPLVV